MVRDIRELNFPKIEGKQYASLAHAEVKHEDMGEKTITTQVKIDGEIVPDFSFDWEVVFRSEKYIMPLRIPQGAKENTSLNSTIDLTFQHWAIYQLKRFNFTTIQQIAAGTYLPDEEVATVQLNLSDFCELFGQVLEYYYGVAITIDLNPAWQYKQEATIITISHTTIWDVLINTFHDKYGVRWEIIPASDNDNTVKGGERYVIRVGYPTTEVDHIFEYGFEGGLLKVERQVQSEEIRNIIKGRGGDTNIPLRYFKNTDPNNPDFAPDPDWVEELANIPFTNLMPATFRSYVQGWKAAHISKYPGYTAVGENNAYAPWAYRKGYTDTTFHPVEFVADEITLTPTTGDRRVEILPGYSPYVKKGSSLDKYGPLQETLDNEDDTYPTLQGTGMDIAVDVEQVSVGGAEGEAGDATIKKVGGASVSATLAAYARKVVTTGSTAFDIPEGRVANLIVDAGTPLTNPDKAGVEKVEVFVTGGDGKLHAASGLGPGHYGYYIRMTVYNMTDSELTARFGAEEARLQDAELADAERGTFAMWVKNIWGSSRRAGESDTEYAERVWKPVFGDRTKNKAAVVFTSGALAHEDYEFLITGWPKPDESKTWTDAEEKVHRSSWRLMLAKSDAEYDATGLYVPSEQKQGQAGDRFVLTGTELTHVPYVTDAEERLDNNKKDVLGKMSEIQPVFTVRTDRVRLNGGGRQDALIHRLGAGVRMTLRDTRFIGGSNQATLYVRSITWSYREPSSEDAALNPDVELVLSDSFGSGTDVLGAIQNEVSAIQRQLGSLSNVKEAVRGVGDRVYLRKDKSDRTSYDLTARSFRTGNYREGRSGGRIGADGDVEGRDLTVRGRADFGEWAPGLSGASVWTDAQGTSHVEGDVFHVRRKLTAREVEIQKERHVGGAVILSPAGAVLTRVEEKAGAWRCYFEGSDAQGRVVYNEFESGDLVRCKTFALERQEDGMTGNRYWWRLCVATGTSHYVYDEKTGTRLENLCAEPRPAGVSVTSDGYFKHADGSYTPLGEVPAAGEVVTLRIRGRFAKAREGDLWASTSVFLGVNWNAGVTVPVEGGIDNEVAEVTFAWPADATEARMMIWSARRVAQGVYEADSRSTLELVELVRGTSVSGEERTEHWIEVSKTDCDPSVENSAPSEGDEVHTVGSKTDPTRGNVVMLSAYDAGSGLAPCLVCYEKIDSYSFPAEKLTARLSPSGNFIRGEFKVRVGESYMDVKDWAKGMAEGYTNTQFNVLAERINSSVTEVKAYTNNQVQGVSDLLSSGLNTVQGNVDSLRRYVDGEYYDALTDILDGLENNIGSVSFRTSTLEQTAEAITERVVSVEADAAGLKQSVGELEVRSDRITAQVSTTRQAVPNLCATPFVDAVSSAASGYFAAGTYFALTEEIEAGATVTVRLRGRFYPGGVVTVFAGSWSMGGVLSTEKPVVGGIDNEEVVGTFTASASGVPGKKLIIQTGKYIDGQWHYSGDCNLKYIAVVRGAVMPQAYREEDALGDALLPTGIDIRERRVKITADNFEVENNSGERTMLVDENGQITAKLIDADSITARRVEAGAKDGERVVIDPAEKSVAVYDSEGRQCTVLDGTRYPSGPASLGDFGAFDSIDIGPLAGGRWTSTNKLPGTRTYTSGDFQFAAGTVRVSGTIAVSASLSARPATETDGNGLAVNVGAQYAQVTATLTLTVGTQTFAIGEETLKLQHGGLAAGGNSYPAQEKTNTLNLGSKTVNIAAAGTGRLTLTLKNSSDCKAGMYSTGAEWTLAMGKMETRYISRYFANGLILGSSTSRYFAAWHGADGYMNFETRNDSAGLRLTKAGAYMLGPEGSWHPLYTPLGFFYIEPVAGSTAVNVRMSGGGSLPAPTAVSSGGTITLTFGQAWADAGISIQQAWPRITPTKAGSAIAMTGMTANTMSFATTDSGVATPVRFFMELVLKHN